MILPVELYSILFGTDTGSPDRRQGVHDWQAGYGRCSRTFSNGPPTLLRSEYATSSPISHPLCVPLFPG